MLGRRKERQVEADPESERMRMLIGLLATKSETSSFEPKAFAISVEAMMEDFSVEAQETLSVS